MRFIGQLKARFPRLFPLATAIALVGTIGGIAVYERQAQAGEDCCYPGSPCCHPGAACCAKHRATAAR